MAAITIELPWLLEAVLEDTENLTVEATTLSDAMDQIRSLHPTLAVHLFDEQGELRTHVLCFYNETNTRWLESLDVPVSDGDRVMFMQAVSGG